MSADLAQIQSDKLAAVLDWAEQHPEFDDGFVKSLAEKFESFGSLTENQSRALDNIIQKWRIDD